MLRITYQTYSPIIGNNTVTDDFKSIEDFRLFAYSLFSGNWSIVKIDNV